MLVSAFAGPERHHDIAAGRLPCPEFLRLERRHDVALLDWTALGLSTGNRSVPRSIHHVGAALRRLRDVDVVFSDGEHVGIPLALSMPAARAKTAHVMLGHHLLTPAKTRVFRVLRPARRIDRILVHSPNQLERIERELGVPRAKLRVVPFGIDTDFWSGSHDDEDGDLVVAAGREHRDYATLLAARPEGSKLAIADHSLFSPRASRSDPIAWPADVDRVAPRPDGLKSLYARAAVVVVPVVDTSFPAGITTLLEAMSMGKAVVVTETAGLRGIVEDGHTAMVVPPGDAPSMNAAIRDLLASPERRHALGARARARAVEHHGLDGYADNLRSHLAEVAARPERRAHP
jgi:glycosyltransferase involved in cell wall biosynthesis